MERWTLPEGWEWKRLGESDLCEIIMGQSPPGDTYNTRGEGLPFFQGKADFGEFYPTPRKWCTCPLRVSYPGDVLISVRAPVGPVNLTAEECIIGRGLAVLRPKTKLESRYLFFVLRSLEESIASTGTGSTFTAINKDDLMSLTIPLPYPSDPTRSLAEQRRIVARLEALLGEVREMRALQAAIEADVGRLMEAALGEVFSRESTSGWTKMTLGSVVEITAPVVDPTLPEYKTLPHINGECIQKATGELLSYRTAEQDEIVSAKYLFKAGDVLYSKIRPYLKKAVIVDFAGVCSADVYPLSVTGSDLLAGFLKWVLLSHDFTNYAIEASKRARMPKINRSQLLSYQIRIPSLAEQRRIVAYLDAVQVEVNAARRLVTHDRQALEQLEQSILAAAFQGEV